MPWTRTRIPLVGLPQDLDHGTSLLLELELELEPKPSTIS